MTRKTKTVILVGAAAGLALAAEVVREQYAPITEQYAREAAQTRFAHFCRDFHLQPSDYEPPFSTNVGGADFAYEWKSKRPGVRSVLISVARGGGVEPAWLDEGQ